MEEIVEMYIPNILGSEKAAIEKAAAIARQMGFSDDRIDDLKTAVSEACINAIEHGNKFDQNTKVGITLAADQHALQITVQDQGNGIKPEKIPESILDEQGLPRRRGHGIFLIRSLVNELSFANQPNQGNAVRMVIHLEQNKKMTGC